MKSHLFHRENKFGMLFIDIVSWMTVIFLGYYLIIRLYIISCCSKGRIVDIENRNYITKFQQNITVIVYSHNNETNIIDLIESLKKQDYDQDKYSINVILDNCLDSSAKLLEILGGTRLWRINTEVKPIGRYKAIGWLLERILSAENTNAFVFINADCLVKSNFIARVNAAIQDNPVLAGEILPLNLYPNLMTRLLCLKNKVKNRVVNYGRCYASLGNIMEGDICAIRQDILEKVNFNLYDYGFEEYEYSIKLNKSKIKVGYSDQICAYKQFSENFKTVTFDEYKTRYKKFITLKNNCRLLFSKKIDVNTKELILSLIYPSSAVYITLCLISAHLLSQNKHIPLVLLAGYLFSTLLAAIVARFNFDDYKNSLSAILLQPVILVASLFKGFKLKLKLPGIFKIKFKKNSLFKTGSFKQTVSAVISDGKKCIPCNLKIRQNKGKAQIFFLFKNKKLVSSIHPRIDEAVEEISEKLKSHGFELKICMNCNYFKPDDEILAKFQGMQSYCMYDNVHKQSKAKEYTYIWNSCSNIATAGVKEPLRQEATVIPFKQDRKED